MIKKLSIVMVFGLLLLTLSGCSFFTKEKEFTGSGITITLTSDFYEKEIVQFPLYLESKKYIVTGLRESKSDVEKLGLTDLHSYIDGIIRANGKTATIETLEHNGKTFYYAYYTSEVSGRIFGYQILVAEGETHFYLMNFGCLEKNFEDSKETFIKWSKTVKVE